MVLKAPWQSIVFLSPPSARRATNHVAAKQAAAQFLSPPSARRATPEVLCNPQSPFISIPALREEGDVARFSISA